MRNATPTHPGLAAIGALGALLAILVASARAPATFGIVTARTAQPANTYSTTALYGPTGVNASGGARHIDVMWNNDARLGAEPVSAVSGAGYIVVGRDNGSNASCPAPDFSAPNYTTPVGATDGAGGGFVDARHTPQGNYFCYAVQASYTAGGADWRSLTNNAATGVAGTFTPAGIQLGFVATSVTLVNNGDPLSMPSCLLLLLNGIAGLPGRLDCGDQIVITFNRPVNPSTGPTSTTTGDDGDTVCTDAASGRVWIGSTVPLFGATCATSEPANVGYLEGGTASANRRFTALYGWSNGNRTLTITIRKNSAILYPALDAASRTLFPAPQPGKLLTADTTDCAGGCPICISNEGGGNCLPSTDSAAFAQPPAFQPPANVRLDESTTGGARITWSAASGVPVRGYRLLIQGPGQPGGVATFDVGEQLSWNVAGLIPGVVYPVVVVAYGHDGGDLAASAPVTIVAPSQWLPPEQPVERTPPRLLPIR